jgi:hypothetical protein
MPIEFVALERHLAAEVSALQAELNRRSGLPQWGERFGPQVRPNSSYGILSVLSVPPEAFPISHSATTLPEILRFPTDQLNALALARCRKRRGKPKRRRS